MNKIVNCGERISDGLENGEAIDLYVTIPLYAHNIVIRHRYFSPFDTEKIDEKKFDYDVEVLQDRRGIIERQLHYQVTGEWDKI